MQNHLTSLLGIAVLVASLPAQDIVYYRFDDAYGSKVINYAANSPAAAQGTITSTLPNAPASSWVPGRYGSALASGIASPITPNRVDTGWIPGTFTGSFSYATWFRKGPNPAPAGIYYIFGSPTSGAFRVYGSGTGSSLYTTGFPSSVTNSSNVYGLASAGWVHLAFVADATTLTGSYYVNGVFTNSGTISAPTWSSTVPFTVGQQLTSSPGSPFEIDEFLLTKRVLTATEIAAMASRSFASDAPYGGGCGGAMLASTGGRPTTGNGSYQLTLTSPNAVSFAIGLGSNRASLGGVPLPFDLSLVFPSLGTCMVESSIDLVSLGGAKGPGSVTVPLPIPANPALDGLTLFLQAPVFSGLSLLGVSNAFSVGIGN